MSLAPADRSKLARVLGMLGSPHAGERDAAALAADRLVRGRGLNWLDVLGQHVPPPAANDTASPYGPGASHLGDLAACGRRPDLLTPWETAFVTGLAAQRNPASRKQRETLAGIAAKVRSAGPRAG